MELTSKALTANEPIPLPYAELSAGGENLRPDLAWSQVPEGAQSFAVTCFDPDAPTGSGWWHWVAFDVPADVTSIATGGDFPGREWENDYGYVGWGGPCPPAGSTHQYVFTVYALDVPNLPIGEKMTSAAVRFTILEHAIDQASFAAPYTMPESAGL